MSKGTTADTVDGDYRHHAGMSGMPRSSGD